MISLIEYLGRQIDRNRETPNLQSNDHLEILTWIESQRDFSQPRGRYKTMTRQHKLCRLKIRNSQFLMLWIGLHCHLNKSLHELCIIINFW